MESIFTMSARTAWEALQLAAVGDDDLDLGVSLLGSIALDLLHNIQALPCNQLRITIFVTRFLTYRCDLAEHNVRAVKPVQCIQ